MSVHARATGSASGARVAFAVGKSVGDAVTRNRVRRRLRHLVRERLGMLPVGVDVVVRAGAPARDLDYPSLGRCLDRALHAALPVPGAGGPV
jgi:ribonuclease P protein component